MPSTTSTMLRTPPPAADAEEKSTPNTATTATAPMQHARKVVSTRRLMSTLPAVLRWRTLPIPAMAETSEMKMKGPTIAESTPTMVM